VDQIELLKFTIQALERLKISYAIVGSFASGVWGESRFTQDIDILVALKPSDVPLLCAAFPSDEFYVSQVAANEDVVRHGQFNVIHPTSGNKIDFMIAGDSPWVQAQLARHKRIAFFPDQDGAVATAEDVILGKLVYYQEGGSDKHLRDIAGILKFSGDDLDRDYLTRLATQLGVADVWQSVLSKIHPT
jgi:predicted nucleotidyltransferase